LALIVLIDDDPSLLEVLSLALEDAGHEVRRAADGLEGLAALRAGGVDLVVSDVNMPRLDGFALCRKLRGAGDATPVVLLTSRDNEIDEAMGLELGADDYLSKPFSTRVLLARIAALLRRDELRRGGPARAVRLVEGALELDAERLECRYRATPVTVTVTEFRLLETLARRPGILFGREQLLKAIRGDDDCVVVDRIVDTYVRRLRRKLEAVEPAFDRIETVVGVGYRWRDR
jgi:DNA-binding response OmpR family regulator